MKGDRRDSPGSNIDQSVPRSAPTIPKSNRGNHGTPAKHRGNSSGGKNLPPGAIAALSDAAIDRLLAEEEV